MSPRAARVDVAVRLVPTVRVLVDAAGFCAGGLPTASEVLAAAFAARPTRLLRSFSTPCSLASERRVDRRVCVCVMCTSACRRVGAREGREGRGAGGTDRRGEDVTEMVERSVSFFPPRACGRAREGEARTAMV